jgi:adenylate cyclase
MFADIRGFTSLAEDFDPEGLTELINRFLTPMTGIIMASGGTIDKYIGDCVMAFWNAPLDDDTHVTHGCASALAMLAACRELNREREAEDEADGRLHKPIRIGIGINTDEVCVGNMGSDQRFDYSVLGDGVNLASRLEGQCKTYRVDVVIGERTQAQLDAMATLELDLIQVKGRARPERIYTLIGDGGVAGSDGFMSLVEQHDAMLAAYRSQAWDDCESYLSSCRELADGWAMGNYYDLIAERIDDFRAEPPGEGWDGVYVATSK